MREAGESLCEESAAVLVGSEGLVRGIMRVFIVEPEGEKGLMGQV